jgi:hypothetical protein
MLTRAAAGLPVGRPLCGIAAKGGDVSFLSRPSRDDEFELVTARGLDKIGLRFSPIRSQHVYGSPPAGWFAGHGKGDVPPFPLSPIKSYRENCLADSRGTMEVKGRTMNTRRHERTPVYWPARIDIGDDVITGHVRDWTTAGACFEPVAGRVRGKFVSGQTALEQLAISDDLQLVTVGVRIHNRTAAVRWAGQSQEHGCAAIGLEFA